jgi:hypothetical protein
MNEHTMEAGGRAWAKTHPHEADRLQEAITGMFIGKKCHENQPDELLCPNCFREFVRLAAEEDASLGESMSKGGYTSTRAWLRGVLSLSEA